MRSRILFASVAVALFGGVLTGCVEPPPPAVVNVAGSITFYRSDTAPAGGVATLCTDQAARLRFTSSYSTGFTVVMNGVSQSSGPTYEWTTPDPVGPGCGSMQAYAFSLVPPSILVSVDFAPGEPPTE